MKTKQILIIVTAWALLSMYMTACKRGDTPDLPQEVTITFVPTTVTLPALGGSQTVTVTATNTTNWLASSDAGWLTVTKTGNTGIQITAETNRGSSRNTTVRCTAGAASASVSVSQAALTTTQSDSLALLDLYQATAGAGWTTKWTLSNRMSQWHGVKVENGRVTELDLPSNNLTGILPGSIGDLTALTYCDLHGNALREGVPATISQWTQLVFLDLSENGFAGAFPAIPALTKLVMLDGSFNAFTSLPALNSLTALEYLAFSKNSLSGSLPANWSSLTKLLYADMSFNAFSGSIPAEWTALSRIQALYLYKNTLSGALPGYLGDRTDLKTLALDGNNLTGEIPAGWGAQLKLAELWLAQNRLTGNIPASLLGNTHWNEWKNEVCPQQSGYGFTNCTGSASASERSSLSNAAQRQLYKEKYRRKSNGVRSPLQK